MAGNWSLLDAIHVNFMKHNGNPNASNALNDTYRFSIVDSALQSIFTDDARSDLIADPFATIRKLITVHITSLAVHTTNPNRIADT